ncbi:MULTISPECIES: hypothetical protein [unclassified Agarivorans]|uniref:hypothetical protein n=1 Tax=unclassified Agarivorans TaxID=2636026 RepID=UPI0026E3539F|nr:MULTISPECIES: hypothetical protein [unclassified Agarivorans]MDO6685868.1 hypothetical protein [Agarivorans sp. 3_MG-2023]MDO6716017.1 hypothetical protein [Agarivorans sp. 2_MG-2023]
MTKIVRSIAPVSIQRLEQNSQKSRVKKKEAVSERLQRKPTAIDFSALKKLYNDNPQEAIFKLNQNIISKHPLAEKLTENDIIKLSGKISSLLASDEDMQLLLEQILNSSK